MLTLVGILAEGSVGQVAVRLPGISGRTLEIRDAGDAVWVRTEAGIFRVAGETVHQVLDASAHVRRIELAGGEVWLLAGSREEPGPCWRVMAGATAAEPLDAGVVAQVVDAGDVAWLVTPEGVGPAPDGEFAAVLDQQFEVRCLRGFGGAVWIGTAQGAFQHQHGRLRRMPDRELDVREMAVLGGRLWLLTSQGAWRVESDRAVRLPDLDLHVAHATEIEGSVWLGTSQGAWKVDGDQVARVTGDKLFVSRVEQIQGAIVLVALRGVYRIEDGVPVRVGGTYAEVREVKEAGGRLWMLGARRLFEVRDGAAQAVEGLGAGILEVTEAEGQVWAATGDRIFRLQGGGAVAFPSQDVHISAVSSTGSGFWIGSRRGAWLARGAAIQRIPDLDLEITCLEEEAGGEFFWLGTADGLYRVNPEMQLSLEVVRTDTLWGKLLEGFGLEDVWVRGSLGCRLGYRGAGALPAVATTDPSFSLTLGENTLAFSGDSATLPLQGLGLGRKSLILRVTDQYGNTREQKLTGVIVPPVAGLILLLGLCWGCFVLAIFLGAAENSFCHRLLMRPAFRWWGTLGVLPLVLSLSWFPRRFLLKRYLRFCERDERNWLARYTLPADDLHPRNLARRLQQQGTLLLLGDPGMGKSTALAFLAHVFARERIRPGAPVPVYLDCRRSKPLELVHEILSSQGELTAAGLRQRLLRRGRFLFFIDGLDEASADRRQDVLEFVRRYSRSNWMVVGSASTHPRDFSPEQILALPPPPQPVVNSLLCRRLEGGQAVKLTSLVEEHWEVYGNPQDLCFLVELVHRDPTLTEEPDRLPRSVPELYAALMEPALQEWAPESTELLSEQLFGLAYAVLRSEDGLAGGLPDLPPRLRTGLENAGLLASQEKPLTFRHELIHTYLAARHFAGRWRELLADLQVERPWLPMLRFVLQELVMTGEEEDARELFRALQERGLPEALELHRWLQQEQPGLAPVILGEVDVAEPQLHA